MYLSYISSSSVQFTCSLVEIFLLFSIQAPLRGFEVGAGMVLLGGKLMDNQNYVEAKYWCFPLTIKSLQTVSSAPNPDSFNNFQTTENIYRLEIDYM